ncbi:YceK/YidQ family lipoprotein [Pseudomonas sp. PDM20]|uniref:YceK/YidQ family lipoprotein n=1 Tax=Pseudomonas sp. PDM20 TaxID=2769254 RepID=UPI00178214ED|nr:YceK/YidQ family lipoprotein [Pseudomonas sp. PDM20]MBD9682934.1 YceK/YidQ family lipoprotein [Pseudomonas sp. PDM20]
MNFHTLSACAINKGSATNGSPIRLLIGRAVQFSTLAFVLSTLIGCGTLGAAVSYGPTCPYQGLSWDFAAMTDWSAIKSTLGFNIVLGALDTPFSFIADTLTLPLTDWSEEDLSQCPRHFN